MCTPVHFSEKLDKYYLDGNNLLIDVLLDSVKKTVEVLKLKVNLNIEATAGLNWAQCH